MTDTDTRPPGFRDTPGSYESGTKMPVNLIRPAPDNLRGDLGDLTELRASIRRNGMYHPILIAPLQPPIDGIDPEHDGCRWVCVDGHRRLAAVIAEGFDRVNVVIRHMSETDRVEAMLATALQREGLRPSEEADGYARLAALGRSQRDIAAMVGVTQPHVSKTMALAKLPEAARAQVDAGGITRELGQALATLPEEKVADLFKGDRPPDRWRIEQTIANHQMAEKRAKAEADAREKGLTVLDRSKVAYYGMGPKGALWLRDLRQYGHPGCTAKEHAKLKCHAVAWSGSSLDGVCKKPANHPKPAAKEPAARELSPQQKEQEAREAALAESRARRFEFCRGLISTVNVNRIVALAAAVVPLAGDENLAGALELLGVEPISPSKWSQDTHCKQLAEFAGTEPRTEAQVLYALALNLGELYCGRERGSAESHHVHAYLDHLVERGYEMSDLERSWLPADEADLVETVLGEAEDLVDDEDLDSELARAIESDQAASRTCQALADIADAGTSIPWPSITKPMDVWLDTDLDDEDILYGRAQDVCRALAAHVAHNGSIPWPAVKTAFTAWQGLHEGGVCQNGPTDEGEEPRQADIETVPLADPDDPDGPIDLPPTEALAEAEEEPEYTGEVHPVDGVAGRTTYLWRCTCGALSSPWPSEPEAEAELYEHMVDDHRYDLVEP